MLFGFNKNSKADNLYLSIRPASFIDNIPNTIVYQKLNDNLIIVLKTSEVPKDVNLPSSIQSKDGKDILITGATSYILKTDVAKYGVSESKLFDIALNNFDSLRMPLDAVHNDAGKTTMLIPKWDTNSKYGEDVVQSNLISELSLNLFKEQLGEEFYVRMSNYEVFTAISKNVSQKDWEAVRNISQSDYKNQPHPLSDKLFLYSNGKLVAVEDKYP